MKKSLLFVAALFAAVSSNAQGTWHAVGADDVVDAVVAEAGTPTQVAADAIQNATVVLYDGGANWTVKNALADASQFVGADGVTYNSCYIQGGTNGSDGSLDKNGSVSAHIEFTPAVDGKVYVAAKYGKSKKIWAAEVPASVIENEELDYADMSAYNTLGVWGAYITPEGGLAAEQAADSDVYAALGYDVKAGNTYFFWVSGSKIMLCGLTFMTGNTAVENFTVDAANVNAPVYNVLGQRVNNDAKGLLIQNGKKFIRK